MKNSINPEIDLSVSLGELTLSNPVLAASGTFGYGIEYDPFVDLDRLGGFATKGLSLKPRIGNPVPRMVETPEGMLNAIGLENIGLEKFLSQKLPLLHGFKTRILVNFFGDTLEEYKEMAAALSEVERIDALEMNISCPNVKEGGLRFSTDPEIVQKLVKEVRGAAKRFLIVKLSPNVTDISEIARAAEQGGADAISLINTLLGMAMDFQKGKPVLANGTGGLSGPAIKPVALHMVHAVARSVKIPVIGIGGISTAEDVIEFIQAGARAVQIGTANFIDPGVTMRVLDNLENYCRKRGAKKIADLV